MAAFLMVILTWSSLIHGFNTAIACTTTTVGVEGGLTTYKNKYRKMHYYY